MQQFWQQSLDWDEPVNAQLHQEWLTIAKDLEAAQQTIIQRHYHSISSHDHQNPTQMHIFVDWSKQAYGAVAYLLQYSQASFVMAKTCVATIKPLTLPQLELMAAVIAARLAFNAHLYRLLEKRRKDQERLRQKMMI